MCIPLNLCVCVRYHFQDIVCIWWLLFFFLFTSPSSHSRFFRLLRKQFSHLVKSKQKANTKSGFQRECVLSLRLLFDDPLYFHCSFKLYFNILLFAYKPQRIATLIDDFLFLIQFVYWFLFAIVETFNAIDFFQKNKSFNSIVNNCQY